MNKDEIKAELETLRNRIKQLEKELEGRDRQQRQESCGAGFMGSYSSRRVGPSGGGRTARPTRGRYSY